MEDDDIIVAGPATARQVSEDDRIIVEDVAVEASGSAAPAAACKRRRRDIPWEGTFCAWVVSDPNCPAPADAADWGLLPESAASRVAVGVSECRWGFVELAVDVADQHEALAPRARAPSQARPPWGFLRYQVLRVWKLDTAVHITGDDDFSKPTSTNRVYKLASSVRLGNTVGKLVL